MASDACDGAGQEPLTFAAGLENDSLNATDGLRKDSLNATEGLRKELEVSLEERSGPQEAPWTWQALEASEWQALCLGPFEAGATCEILHAWYGVPGDPGRQVNCTHWLRHAWNAATGLRLTGFNRLFGDPAPLRAKRLVVEYRLRNVRSWDVSRGTYAEGGVRRLQLMPVIAAKTVTNFVGATVAASGYVVGKALTAMSNSIASGEPDSVADSTAFQLGFSTWLRLNGIWPSVTYDEVAGDSAPWDMKQTPIIVSNHVCYLDGLVLAAVFGAPKIIAMKGTLNVPILGVFAAELGVIEVDRSNPCSRAATRKAIEEHVECWQPGRRPLLLFPEGTTSNGDSMLEFKKGAFAPGAPLRPVVMCYTGAWDPATTNFRLSSNGDLAPTGDGEWCEQFLGHAMHSMQIRVLPPYVPSEAERSNSELFAANVRQTMGRAQEQLRLE
ncbi:unnamed protein product, partial [Polarella glacialis]